MFTQFRDKTHMYNANVFLKNVILLVGLALQFSLVTSLKNTENSMETKGTSSSIMIPAKLPSLNCRFLNSV